MEMIAKIAVGWEFTSFVKFARTGTSINKKILETP